MASSGEEAVGEKVCRGCDRMLPLGSYTHVSCRDGFLGKCKECRCRIERERCKRRTEALEDQDREEQDPEEEERPGEKACNGCDRMLPLSSYSQHASCRDGLASRCKECKARHNREQYKRRIEALDALEDQEEQEEPPAKRPCPSDLYIMSLSFDPAGLRHGLKIGRSSRVEERARDLTASLPFEMVVLATFPGAGHLEEAVHAHLAPKRNEDSTAREWFRVSLSEAVLAIVVQIKH